MGMTLAEKILARASGRENVNPGEYVTADIDLAMAHEGFAAVYLGLLGAGINRVWNPDKIVVLLDHAVPAPNVRYAGVHKMVREAVKNLSIKNFYDVKAGVCHQVLQEKGHVLPGMLIVGTDSHTTTYGALTAAGTGIGFTEMSYVFATGKLWFRVPETVKFEISGKLPRNVMSKDVILNLLGKYSAEAAQYKSVEFTGSLSEGLSISSRMTMSNMALEMGAKFAFFETDQKTIDYLKDKTKKPIQNLKADKDAEYEKVYKENVTELEPQVAAPYTVDNVKPVTEFEGVPVNQALLGSCTNGRLEDLQIAAKILEGKKVHPDTRLIVTPASTEVYREAVKEGIIETMVDAEGIICNPSCGACFGANMGLLAAGEVCIASINRNFRGRMGDPESKVYLASPATVAASAIEGKITDPRKY
ncbi:MAG: 3-isopropylmalate dehydratase large subunit [Candidatus Jordarchaeum sp.]|uniref:3-isopropylmalate dehydratase large subunit n=1 Tax=Candidatus Jordarchaeum sp. TaxID=2823881 RepID=UPI00404B7E25